MKKHILAAAAVTATLTLALTANAALSAEPLDVADLEALTILDALPDDATGAADTARDVFTAVNERAEGVVPVLPLLRFEDTLARGLLAIVPSPWQGPSEHRSLQ